MESSANRRSALVNHVSKKITYKIGGGWGISRAGKGDVIHSILHANAADLASTKGQTQGPHREPRSGPHSRIPRPLRKTLQEKVIRRALLPLDPPLTEESGSVIHSMKRKGLK